MNERHDRSVHPATGERPTAPTGPKASVMTVAILLAATATAPVAAAEPRTSTDRALILAQAEQTRSFAIEAQPLASALARFSERTGISFAYSTEQVEGIESPGATGELTAEEALQRLLAGTGLEYRFTSADTVALAENGEGSGRLAPIQVEARPESAIGPDPDVVPARSRTATKIGSPIEDLPQSISVITTRELEARPVTHLNDALAYTAGVNVDTAGQDDRFDLFRIRGFDQGQSGSYRDGLERRINASFIQSRIEPYGLQRVEVFKGSTSSLYGQNSPGGLVNVITKRPPEDRLREIFAGAGSHDTVEAGLDLGGPLTGDGRVLGRFTALVRDGETQVDESRDDRTYLAPAITWRPSDRTSLTVLARYDDTRAFPAQSGPIVGTVEPNPNGSIEPDFLSGDPDVEEFDTEDTALSYHLEHAFSDRVLLRQKARVNSVEVDYKTLFPFGSLQADQRTQPRASFAVDGETDRLVVDTQLHLEHGTGALRNKAVFGVDVSHDETEEVRRFGSATPIDVFDPDRTGNSILTLPVTSDRDIEETNVGLYVSDELTVSERWIISGGLRHDRVDTETDDNLAGTTDDKDDDETTGRIGLTYRSALGLNPYVSYGESFEPTSATLADGSEAAPLEGEQYEAGLKYRPTGFEGLFTLAGFRIEQSNRLVSTPTGSVQRGEFEVEGLEAEARAELDSGWRFVGAATYLDTEITEGDNEGNETTQTPDRQLSLWAGRRFDGDSPLAGLEAGLGYRYVGETWADEANTLKIDSYEVVDASLRYALRPGLDLELEANNLFDEEFVATCFPGFGSCFFGDTRSVNVSLHYRW